MAQKERKAAPKFNISNIPARRPFGRRRKVCPFSGACRAEDRLQGREDAPALHQRKGQDRAGAHHRRFRQEATRTRRPSNSPANWRCCPSPFSEEDEPCKSSCLNASKTGGIGDEVKVRDGFARNSCCRARRRSAPTTPTARSSKAGAPKSKPATPKPRPRRKRPPEMDGTSYVLIRSGGRSGPALRLGLLARLADAMSTPGRNRSLDVALDKPIKTLGLYDVNVRLHSDVYDTVNLNIARSTDEAERQPAAKT